MKLYFRKRRVSFHFKSSWQRLYLVCSFEGALIGFELSCHNIEAIASADLFNTLADFCSVVHNRVNKVVMDSSLFECGEEMVKLRIF